MKLSKDQIKQHKSALTILEKDILTEEDKEFVFNNWIPAYNNQIGEIGSFFTPFDLAYDFTCNTFGFNGVEGKEWKVIDLCAGIGILSYAAYNFYNKKPHLTCIERNSEFIEVGKKLLPDANWILGDVLDEEFIKSLGNEYNLVISNPPYGNKIEGDSTWLKYKGKEFEYKVIEVGSYLSNRGCFLIPQGSCPFQYSGKPYYMDEHIPKKYEKFNKETGITLEMNAGFDTSIYKDDWVGTTIITEIALVEY